MENSQKNGWLRRVQEQSWEPEIIISGIVLFALFQIPQRIDAFSDYLELNSMYFFSDGTINEALASVLKVALYWLIIGFSLHLFLRSVWTAFVGLSYVYGDGIDTEQLPYHEKFRRIIAREPDYDKRIQQLERLCSTLFSVTFLLFMCTIGAIFYIIFVGLVAFMYYEIFPPDNSGFSADAFALTLGGLYLIDFITLGGVKRIPYLNRVYYPIYRLMSVITLAPFYRGIYYGFVTNHRRWKVMLGGFLFVVISITWSMAIRQNAEPLSVIDLSVSSDEEYLYQGHYADAYADDPSRVVHIPSDIIERNVLRVFVVHSSAYEERYIKKLCDYEKKAAHPDVDTDSLRLACLQSFYVLGINDSLYEASAMFFQKDLRTRQLGLVSWLDIRDLPRGPHQLRVYYRFPPKDKELEPYLRERAVVEFFKDGPQ